MQTKAKKSILASFTAYGITDLGVQEAVMPQPQLLCRICGHLKGSHGHLRQVPLSLEFIQGYQKAVSDCPGYDSGDADAELASQQHQAVQQETAILDELRPGSHLGQHYD